MWRCCCCASRRRRMGDAAAEAAFARVFARRAGELREAGEALRALQQQLAAAQAGAARERRLAQQQRARMRRFEQACDAYVVQLNQLAVFCLAHGRRGECRRLLGEARRLSRPEWGGAVADLRVLTLNNWYCLLREEGAEAGEASEALREAVRLAKRGSGRSEHLAVTHLLLCAALSLQGRHEAAFKQSQVATHLAERSARELAGDGRLAEARLAPPQRRRLANLRLAALLGYHNAAVEAEHLGQQDLARAFVERSGNVLARRLSWLLEYAVSPHRGELPARAGGQYDVRVHGRQLSDDKLHHALLDEPDDEPREIAWILELPAAGSRGASSSSRARAGSGDSGAAAAADTAARPVAPGGRRAGERAPATTRPRPGTAGATAGGRLGLAGAARTGAAAPRLASAAASSRAASKGRAAASGTAPGAAPGAGPRGTPTVQTGAVSDEELFSPWATTAAATTTVTRRDGASGKPAVPSKSPVVLERRTPVAAAPGSRRAARDGAEGAQGEELVIPAYVLRQGSAVRQVKQLRGQSSAGSSPQSKPRPPMPAVPPKLVGPFDSPLRPVPVVTSPKGSPPPPPQPPELVLPGLAKSTPRSPSSPLQAPVGRTERDSPGSRGSSCESKADKAPLASGPPLSSRSEVSLFAFNGGDCALPTSPIQSCSPVSVLPPLGSSGSLSQSSCSLSSCSLSSDCSDGG